MSDLGAGIRVQMMLPGDGSGDDQGGDGPGADLPHGFRVTRDGQELAMLPSLAEVAGYLHGLGTTLLEATAPRGPGLAPR